MHNLLFSYIDSTCLNKLFTLFARKTLPSSISLREISAEHIFAFVEALCLTVTIAKVTFPDCLRGSITHRESIVYIPKFALSLAWMFI